MDFLIDVDGRLVLVTHAPDKLAAGRFALATVRGCHLAALDERQVSAQTQVLAAITVVDYNEVWPAQSPGRQTSDEVPGVA